MDIIKTAKEKGKAILEFIGIFLILFITENVIAIALKQYLKSDNFWLKNLSAVATCLVVTIIFIIIYRKRLLKDLKEFKKEYLSIAFKYWIVGAITMIIINLFLLNFLKDIPSNESANRALIKMLPLYTIFGMCILAPINEEITFRHSLRNIFKNEWAYAILSGLAFGAVHVLGSSWPQVLYIIPYGTLGFVFARAYSKTNNIYTSIIMHATHNTITILFLLITGSVM